jgi:hypothetical protein
MSFVLFDCLKKSREAQDSLILFFTAPFIGAENNGVILLLSFPLPPER